LVPTQAKRTVTNDLSAEKESDLNFIRVGPERYEIPVAVIFGG
jgi:hypothetical protein